MSSTGLEAFQYNVKAMSTDTTATTTASHATATSATDISCQSVNTNSLPYDVAISFVAPDIEEADAPLVLADAKAAGWRSGQIPHPLWKYQYAAIVQQRAKRDAPVDITGTEALVDRSTTPENRRFGVLVACMLSSQTKDEVTGAAVKRLGSAGRLSAQAILDMSESELAEMIKPVGFWRRKATYLKKTAAILVSQYNGDIPTTPAGLIALPGVGPKMAYLALNCAFTPAECVALGIPTNIAVDVHVHRIANRLGWAKSDKPEATRAQLESWLPPVYWRQVNCMLVGFGQQQCLPRNPKCDTCPAVAVCPVGRRSVPTAGTKRTRPSELAPTN